ncbi:MAG: flagellar export chaperone FliS [Desulfobacteraceae bacterium]|nr:flagellar export chaperone FliS [Desulfobacteraceae bacterium]
MSAATKMNTYLNNHYQGKTPEQLIQMLYKGAMRNLNLAKQGIDEKSPRKRGEHLGKAIAIITELYTSLDTEIKDESTQFLRELYSNMLTELPKVSLNNDSKAIDLTYSYIKQLNHIWETEVLNKERGSSGYAAENLHKLDKQTNSPSPKSLFA